MPLRLAPCDLPSLDALRADAIVLFVGNDERPVQGLAGLVDWRLSGGLSRLLKDGVLDGALGERLLTPAPSLGSPRVFVFGTGPARDAAVRFPQVAVEAAETLRKAGIRTAAVGLPAEPVPQVAAPVLQQAFGGPGLDAVLTGDLVLLAKLLPGAVRAS